MFCGGSYDFERSCGMYLWMLSSTQLQMYFASFSAVLAASAEKRVKLVSKVNVLLCSFWLVSGSKLRLWYPSIHIPLPLIILVLMVSSEFPAALIFYDDTKELLSLFSVLLFLKSMSTFFLSLETLLAVRAFAVQNDAILFSFLSLVALTSSYVLGVLFLKSILSVWFLLSTLDILLSLTLLYFDYNPNVWKLLAVVCLDVDYLVSYLDRFYWLLFICCFRTYRSDSSVGMYVNFGDNIS